MMFSAFKAQKSVTTSSFPVRFLAVTALKAAFASIGYNKSLASTDPSHPRPLFVCFAFTILAASNIWVRCPDHERLHRNNQPPPLPPPPALPQDDPVGDNPQDVQETGLGRDEDDDGDDDPGQVAGEEHDEAPPDDGDGPQTAAAPAPEDPSPPPGGVDEADEDNSMEVLENGVSWLLLLLLGRLRPSRQPSDRKSSCAKRQLVLQSSLLQIKPGDSNYPAVIRRLSQRPLPVRSRDSELVEYIPDIRTSIQKAALAAPSAIRRQFYQPSWRTPGVLLALIPAFGFLGSIIELVWSLKALRNRDTSIDDAPITMEQAREPDPPPPPLTLPSSAWTPCLLPLPPSPPTSPPLSPVTSTPRLAPQPPPIRNEGETAKCVKLKMMQVVVHGTVLRATRGDMDLDDEEELDTQARRIRVSAVQGRIWRGLYELHLGEGVEEGS
ncbi:hypothetical protein R3P38DRAFT_3273598 [Favolaschia claudopus]|uniref:Uncharacterized protein n=1 Tax=Favolaschia claudopus TaxID=2862362 RepID=A0AAW0B0D8_9AGAR